MAPNSRSHIVCVSCFGITFSLSISIAFTLFFYYSFFFLFLPSSYILSLVAAPVASTKSSTSLWDPFVFYIICEYDLHHRYTIDVLILCPFAVVLFGFGYLIFGVEHNEDREMRRRTSSKIKSRTTTT